MSLPPATIAPFDGRSVCLFCGSSDGADPQYVQAATAFGKAAAEAAGGGIVAQKRDGIVSYLRTIAALLSAGQAAGPASRP